MNNSEWVDIKILADALGFKTETLRRGCASEKYVCRFKKSGKYKNYEIAISSLPSAYLKKYNNFINKQNNCLQLNSEVYDNAQEWQRKQADKYLQLITLTGGMSYNETVEFLKSWNSAHPDKKVCYTSLYYAKQKYEESGVAGLLSKKGQGNKHRIIPDDYYEYYKSLYLREGAPSAFFCWQATLGYAKDKDNIDILKFPSYKTFERLLKSRIPEQAIYMARFGNAAWNKKYGGYIDRDYSNITCNEVWVSDHAQIDVACFDPDGKVVFPWVTVWRDYKSGKWLGWVLQTKNPNSDFIFQSFYYAAQKFGLPKDVIIDNGKDYRSKDFAGGRSNFKVDISKGQTSAMLKELNVNVHFALPYNAQTKPVERDFLKIKELLSKHCVGYRGGNVVERPEKLANEIKAGKIMQFEDFKKIFDDFILNVLNKKPSNGKNLNGSCPDELFYKEYAEKITPSRDALKLFCMRTSRNFTIGRNGIQDRQLGITYWADWMIARTGLKIYLRRDVQDYKDAWAFKADNDEFVGTVKAVKAVAALHADKVSKEEFKEALSIKKRNLKITKAYIKQIREISLEEQYENYKAAYASSNKDYKKNVKISKIANTNMDKAIQKNKEMESFGRQDLSVFLEDKKPEEKLYLFETDKILEKERIKMETMRAKAL